ncbi:MAG: DUF1127 domain-containing protein [Acetobacteraceae bacterium]
MMNYTHVAPLPPTYFSAGGRLPLRSRFAAWRTEHRRRVRLAHELASLDDRELIDLDISRADFPAIISGTYRRG